MDNTNENAKQKFKLQYQVKGVRSLTPLFHVIEASSVEEASDAAEKELRAVWSKKLGVNAIIVVFHKDFAAKPVAPEPDYQI